MKNPLADIEKAETEAAEHIKEVENKHSEALSAITGDHEKSVAKLKNSLVDNREKVHAVAQEKVDQISSEMEGSLGKELSELESKTKGSQEAAVKAVVSHFIDSRN